MRKAPLPSSTTLPSLKRTGASRKTNEASVMVMEPSSYRNVPAMFSIGGRTTGRADAGAPCTGASTSWMRVSAGSGTIIRW